MRPEKLSVLASSANAMFPIEVEEATDRQRLETEALVLAYAMSRFYLTYLAFRGLATWKEAYDEAAERLGIKASSAKNLRQEFDPFFSNRGWNKRPTRPSRVRVLDELADVSDAAVMELAHRILGGDHVSVVEAVDALAVVTRRPANVAERLLTGRRAEDYFLENCYRLLSIRPEALIDTRIAACGFDFAVDKRPELAIEVKGLKQLVGNVQFTDREWLEAGNRHNNYYVVVVGNVAEPTPTARVFIDPHTTLAAKSSIETTVRAVWQARVSIR